MRDDWLRFAKVGAVLALLGAPAHAQISPGKLSQAHAGLDGSGQCLTCHRTRKGVDPVLCLTCHEPLRKRIEAGNGLHTSPGYQACETCHIEHHGRDFELIWWGDDGEAAFDHRETGHVLQGTHRSAACRDCHQPSNIRDPAPLRAARKDLARTFLGLTTSCVDCHVDTHRGQFEDTSCADCHQQDAWRPPTGFDHARTAFELDNAHQDVACAACHATTTPDDKPARVVFRGTTTACSGCHADPHEDRFGHACASCHGTQGWLSIDPAHFDHRRTGFPLLGRHRTVACASCHPAGASKRIVGFEHCATCHADVHLGQFRDRADGGACQSCHDVEGFEPSRFSIEDHESTRYPLAGAHRTTACAGCHRPVAVENLADASFATAPNHRAATTVQLFTIEEIGCVDCHRDPHDQSSATRTCESCHSVSTWPSVTFDHTETGYPLEGAHRAVDCLGCHDAEGLGAAASTIRFQNEASVCRDCHEDQHRGQLDRPDVPTMCADCHTQAGWAPSTFDHDLSIYRLEGAHRRASCDACHQAEVVDGEEFVRYRPLGMDCADCHRGESLP